MLKATVVGPIWATKRLEGFPAGALLDVRCEEPPRRYVALDTLGSGPGDHVLIAVGSAVSRHLPGAPPLDALVVGVIDEPTTASKRAGTTTRKAQH